MLTSVEGVFQNGKVELTEPVPEGVSGRVIVTFVPVGSSNSQSSSRATCGRFLAVSI